MNQNKRLPLLQNDDSTPSLYVHFFTEWVQKNGKWILYGVFGAIALIFFFTQFIEKREAEKRDAFIQADQEALHYQQDQSDDALLSLQKLVLTYPALEQKYDAFLAQAWLTKENVSSAQPFAESALKQTKNDHLPLYREFAKTSLLIAQGQEETSLKQALALKEELLQLAKKGQPQADILYTFNLLRIVTLQRELGYEKEAASSLQELLSAAKSASPHAYPYPVVVKEILSQVREGELSLEQWLSK